MISCYPMSCEPPETLIARHEAFRQCRPVDRPLLGLWLGGYFPADQFPAGVSRWRPRQVLAPGDVTPATFAPDYERLYRLHCDARDDFFFVGSAYWGIPWLEAILGCAVTVAQRNCQAQPSLDRPDEVGPVDLDQSPWFQLLLRFTRELIALAAGRFPVCPPLLRGPGDCAAAMLGGMSFVTGLLDQPAGMKRLLAHCASVRSAVIHRLGAMIPDWHGTHAAGGYPSKIWSQLTVAYHQDDSAALLSPALFHQFLVPLHRQMCGAAEVNFVHLHSACLWPVDILLEEGVYDIFEINIDHAGSGPPLAKLLETFQRIQSAGRPLLLWGRFTREDWDLVHRELRPAGLSLQPMVRDPADRQVFEKYR